MNTFLNEEQYQIISDMRKLRTGAGGKYKWLLGANTCKVADAEVKFDVHTKPYFVVTLSRGAETINGRRIYFSPHLEYFFSQELLRTFCEAHGHVLADRPPDYPVLDYLKAVCRRIKTFTGDITVTMGVTRKVKRDDYGKEVYGYGSLGFDERGMPMTVFDTPDHVYDYAVLNYTGDVNWKEVFKQSTY